MNNKVLLGLVVAVVLVVAGFLFITRSNQTATQNEMVQPQGEQVMEEELEEATGESMMEERVREFTISGSPFQFDVPEITVNQGDTVRITFKNTQGTHDFTLDEFGVKTKRLAAGEEETVEFVADQRGTFNFYCSVPGHRTSGMEGQLVVE
jgi:plastocyanin